MVLRTFFKPYLFFLFQLCFTNFYNIEIKRYLNVSIVSTFYYLPFFLSEQSAGHQSPSHLKNLFSKVCHKTKIYFILLCVCKGIDSYAKRISHESIPLLDPLIWYRICFIPDTLRTKFYSCVIQFRKEMIHMPSIFPVRFWHSSYLSHMRISCLLCCREISLTINRKITRWTILWSLRGSGLSWKTAIHAPFFYTALQRLFRHLKL